MKQATKTRQRKRKCDDMYLNQSKDPLESSCSPTPNDITLQPTTATEINNYTMDFNHFINISSPVLSTFKSVPRSPSGSSSCGLSATAAYSHKRMHNETTRSASFQTIMLEKITVLQASNDNIVNLLGRLTEEVVKVQRDVKKLKNPNYLNSFSKLSSVIPETPFSDAKLFLNFEKNLQNEDQFNQLVDEFLLETAKDGKAFVSKCWRRVMENGAAKTFPGKELLKKKLQRKWQQQPPYVLHFNASFPKRTLKFLKKKQKPSFCMQKIGKTKVLNTT